MQCYASVGAGAWTFREERHKDVSVLEDPVIKEIAAAKGKSPAQVVIAWHVQRKCIPLCKTKTEARLLENIEGSYDVALTEDEVKRIDDLDANIRLFNPKAFPPGAFDWNGMPYFD